MKLKLLVVPVVLSLCFSALAVVSNDVILQKGQTTIFDGRAAKLPSGEFPEPIDVSFGQFFARL